MADNDPDFERINNAITALSNANYGMPLVDKLADDWQKEAVTPRAWKSLIPFTWSNLMGTYWERYQQVYKLVKNKGRAPAPAQIEPGWVAQQKRELLALSRQAGEEAGQGAGRKASEATQGALVQTLLVGGLIYGGLYLLMRPRRA